MRTPIFKTFSQGLLILMLALFSSGLPAAWAAEPAPKPVFPALAAKSFKPVSERSESVWQQHLTEVAGQPIQAGCRPFRLPAQGSWRRGSIVLLHGFTACPQQYWEIAPMLAAAGYDVFAPLLPGHGRQFQAQNGKVSDDLSDLPTQNSFARYLDFSDRVNALVQDEPLRKLMVGLSVGAAVGAEALGRAPALFDRAVLITPLFDVAYPNNILVPSVHVWLPKGVGDWGPGCEDERSGGRAGYCQFQITNVRSTQLLGYDAISRLGEVKTRVQLVGVESDKAANNEALALGLSRLHFAQGCLFPKGANHSLFARHDAPEENKFWLSSFYRQLLRFVDNGEFFDAPAQSQEINMAICRIDGRM